jgi:putative superfamily III holin-X
MVLLACVVLALATAMPAWLAALITGVAVLLCAGIAVLVGKSQLKNEKGAPE